MAKVAKLVRVSFVTRVVVEDTATDEQILAEAKQDFQYKLNNEINDNLDEISEDEESPYNAENDGE